MGNAGKTVSEILRDKRGRIKNAPLPQGFPGWEPVGDMMWEEVERRARAREPGFRELHKLLSDKRFDR